MTDRGVIFVLLLAVSIAAGVAIAAVDDPIVEARYQSPPELEITDDGDLEISSSYLSGRLVGIYLPAHACDRAEDCETVGEDICTAHGSSRDRSKAVELRWNSTTGQGECRVPCADGGVAVALCKRAG